MQDKQFNDNELKHASDIREECTSVIEDEVDLTEAFDLVYPRGISETDVGNYIMGLIFQLFETSSKSHYRFILQKRIYRMLFAQTSI